MVDGSILTGPDYSFNDDVTYDFVWDTETKLGAGTYDCFDATSDDLSLVIPSSASGELAEVFLYMEASPTPFDFSDDGYIGLINAKGAGGTQTGYDYLTWYYIMRDLGQYSRGIRTGPFEVGADGHYFRGRWRTFGSQHGTMLGARTRIGVLFGDGSPLAAAVLQNTNFLPTPDTWIDMTGTEVFDDGGVLNPTTGIFTAPAGAVCAVPCLNNRTTGDLSPNRTVFALEKNGTEIGRYYHGESARAPGPGCWGLIEATSGDEFQCRIYDDRSFGDPANQQQFWCSVEFY